MPIYSPSLLAFLDTAPVTLTPHTVYQESILATGRPVAGRHYLPTVVINGGQTGAGKSALTSRDVAQLAREPVGVVQIDWDAMRSLLPSSRIKSYHKHDPEHAPHGFPGGGKIIGKYLPYMMSQAIQENRNVHIDGNLDSPQHIEQRARLFHAEGYKVVVHVMMTHPHLSNLGRITRMATAALQLQQALDEADALPPGEREAAIAVAKRNYMPRYPRQHGHDDAAFPEGWNYQPNAVRHAETLLKAGLVDEIELWEQDQPAPTWEAQRKGEASIHILQRGEDAGERQIASKDYVPGTGAELYEAKLQKWRFKDLDTFMRRMEPTRAMLESIKLPQVDTRKYIGHLDDIARAAQKPLQWQLAEQGRSNNRGPRIP